MSEQHCKDMEIEAEYEWSVNANECGAFYEVDITKLTVGGHELKAWPTELQTELVNEIVSCLEDEYGQPRGSALYAPYGGL